VSNPNEFRQSFHTWATSRTASKLGSPPALITLPLSLLYKEWTWELYMKLNLTFVTLFTGRSMGVFIGGLSQCFGRRWGSGATCRAGQPARVDGRPSFLTTLTLGIGCPCTDLPWHVGKAEFEKVPTPSRPAKEVGPTGPTLAQLGLGFVPHHPLVSYSIWLCLILDILKICIDFGPYGSFPSSDVPEMINQQNSWNSLVISTYLLYLKWNVGMLIVNICILWPPTKRSSKGLIFKIISI
jgi:hypothetical protein